ncbi:glycoside hydrolase family 88 protein [Polaribacter sp. Hel1_85]|uniref:glycoside hydrolase family 88 protein n=1 Tax=Polaribacter sp. Hel1_85 TaxID=1250005 RepID=UPI00052DB8B7|nr:glycoside hydrolase family 88 protein [Polaribacter sp. Hel1_85]KGL62288.1 unsaturated glucuronyl hydrolase, GH88 family [Polaribacter sp. Hel1_85]
MTRLFLIAISLLMFACTSTQKKETVFNPSKMLDISAKKIKKTSLELTNSEEFLRNIPKDSVDWKVVGVKDWCSGFWPGVLWYAYEASGDIELKAEAERFTTPVKEIAYTPALDHDIGFQVFCSYGNGYRLTGNEEYKTIILAAADTLATLYNPKVGSILSWPIMVEEMGHNTIIDNMMNLELLFWASKNGGNKELYNIAESHAKVTMKYIVRSDNAVFHVADFNQETGEFVKGHTHQGLSDESMWARGQTWGIYGFAMSYRETGNKDFLNTSIRLADHFLERLPEDGVPYWDFDDPKIPNAPKDASAAGVAACGLLELSSLVEDKVLKEKYFNAAKKSLEILSSKEYFSGDKNKALLLHSTGHLPNNSEIDIPIIYADYYYMEALLRLKKMEAKNK